MTTREKEILTQLIEKIRKVSEDSTDIDIEARNFIEMELAKIPDAPYYMAQTIIMQKGALKEAEKQLLEQDKRSNDFETQRVNQNTGLQQAHYNQSHGGGFLAGAAQTAMGIAGGILLANAAMSVFDDLTSPDTSVDENYFENEPGAHTVEEPGMDNSLDTEMASEEISFDDGGSDFGGEF